MSVSNGVPKGIDDAIAEGANPRIAVGHEETEILEEVHEVAGVGRRPRCEVSGDWDKTRRNLEQALAECGGDLLLFHKDGVLLTPVNGSLDRPGNVSVLKTIVAEHVDFGWWKKDKDGDEQWMSKPPHPGITEALMHAPYLFHPVRKLRRHVTSPTILENGEVTGEPGYYELGEIFYSGEIPHGDLSMDLQEAINVLEEPFADFPFVDDSDRANALAIPLSLIGYEQYKGRPPMGVPLAPKEGSGKSLLVECPMLLTTGKPPATIEYSTNPEEFSKTLFSVALCAPQASMVDNVNGLLDSPKLCSVLSQEETTTRLLGSNSVATIRNDICWFANGNNVELTGELIRRCYLVRINAEMEDPEERSGFRISNLKEWCKRPENQRRYVTANLVIIKAWLDAGAPRFKERCLGSFVDWCEVIGGILEFIGHGAFLANKDHFRASSDPEREMWREFVSEWWNHYKHGEVTASDLYRLVILDDPTRGIDSSFNHRDNPLLPLGNGPTKSQTTKLGHLLRKKLGQVYNIRPRSGSTVALKIDRAAGNLSRSRYHLQPVMGSADVSCTTDSVGDGLGTLF